MLSSVCRPSPPSDLPPTLIATRHLVGTQREYSTLPILSPENRKPVGYVAIDDLLFRLDKGSLRAEDPLETSMRRFATKAGYQGEFARRFLKTPALIVLYSNHTRYR